MPPPIAPSSELSLTPTPVRLQRDAGMRHWLVGIAATAVLGVAAIVGVTFLPHPLPTLPTSSPPPAPGAPTALSTSAAAAEPAAPAPVDAATLTGDADARPVLAQGTPPPSPAPELPLRPTIVCRLLVDASGSVANAAPYAPRAGMEAFEAAAVAAVKNWRFAPARKAGAPVAVWVNWPVTFQQPPHP